ncbi:MAG: YebC/PmpR family DNA-binding transcriptional regulator [Campylobacterota bacterium]
MGRAFEYRKAAKMKRWGAMSRIFPKLAKGIEIAAKAGGDDPEMNPALRTAILNAKAQNLPKANIEAAIKRATGKDAKNYTDVNFEGKGPHGALIFVECATDNNTRTVANVKMLFNKNGGQVVPTGSLEFMFDRKAIFEFEKTDDMDLEELELELIDSGLEELEEDDGIVIAFADFVDFGNMSTKFEELGVELKKAELKRVPNDPKEFSEQQQEEVGKLLEKLEDDDDVQAVFTNMA